MALAARLRGRPWDEIAAELGYRDASGAYRLVKRALNRLPAPEVEEYRRLHLEATNAMLGRLWPKVERGDVAAVRAAVSVMDRQAKLLGLDAPVRVEGASEAEHEAIDQEIRRLIAEIEARAREEAIEELARREASDSSLEPRPASVHEAAERRETHQLRGVELAADANRAHGQGAAVSCSSNLITSSIASSEASRRAPSWASTSAPGTSQIGP